MESLLVWLYELGPYAPLIIFAGLVITGFSLPVSEDLLIIASGVLASTVLGHYSVELFIACLFGSFLADCIAYLIGRLFGAKFASKKEEKMQKLTAFYQKYGFWTLFVGRLIPFGIRNGIFMTAGASKMPFQKFALSDGLACCGFSSLLFFLAYSCGKNYELLLSYVQQTSYVVGIIALACIAAGVIYLLNRKKKAKTTALP